MSIKGVIFDFDGTLFFNSDIHTIATQRIFVKLGFPEPDDDTMVHRIFGRPNSTIYLENIDPNATAEELDRFEIMKETEYQNTCLDMPERLHLVDGASELLDYLKSNGIPYAIATGAPRTNVEFYKKHLGITRWFDDSNIIYHDGSFPGKPAPDIYLLTAKKLGLSPNECMVFEDGTSGIRAANLAGVGAVVAVYDARYSSPVEPDVTVHSIHHDMKAWKEIISDLGLMR